MQDKQESNKSKVQEGTQRFTEVLSQRVIYVFPRPPQSCLPLFAINNYKVGADFQVLSLLFTQVVLSKFHSNL